jgi:hypothetical protein
MATALPNANINIPYSAFLDDNTGRPSQAWLQWLMNPNVISQTTNNVIINGGTINNTTIGLTTPAAGKFTDFTALNGVKGGTF